MEAHTQQSLTSSLKSWQDEDGELGVCVSEVRSWMQELSQMGVPRFGETSIRLRPLRERLVQHFKLEDEILVRLMKSAPELVEELADLHCDARHGHEKLLAELDDLSGRLSEPEPPFDSWQAAIKEIEAFVDLLEQHEHDEAESFEKLLEGR